MIRSLLSFFSLIVLALFAAGCVTYSPFVHAPAEPIMKNHGEIGGSFSALTQSSDGMGDVNVGPEGFLRYGFTDRYSVGLRTWSDDMDWTDGFALNGFSIDGLALLSDTNQSVRYALAPRILFLFEDRTLRANAIALNGLAWLPKLWLFKPYVSIGGGIAQDLEASSDSTNPDFVYAAMGHVGASVDLFSHLSARGEIATVTEFDAINGARVTFIVPSMSLVWNF